MIFIGRCLRSSTWIGDWVRSCSIWIFAAWKDLNDSHGSLGLDDWMSASMVPISQKKQHQPVGTSHVIAVIGIIAVIA